jgi:hypothetical protein
MERYRNGGKYSPLAARRLKRSTESRPLTPKFHMNFARQRESVVLRMRVARAGNMAGED